MPKPKSKRLALDKEEQVIIELIDARKEQLKALKKVLDHVKKEVKK